MKYISICETFWMSISSIKTCSAITKNWLKICINNATCLHGFTQHWRICGRASANLHLKREYVNFHNSRRFEELGELYESTEMSRFVNTRLGTFYVHHRDLRTACLNMTDKGLWYESLLAWNYAQKDLTWFWYSQIQSKFAFLFF